MSDEFAEPFPANAEQAAYWTARSEQWVTHQAALDARLAPVGEQLLTRAAPRPGERVVDVGCGTGATTLAVAEKVGTRGSVLAVDISEPMLAIARRRSTERGHGHVRFLHGDAQSHDFEPKAYDLVLSRFGVMFFSDPVAAFANLMSALRPGGRLAFVCWAPLEDNPWFKEPLAAGIRWLGPPEPQPPRAPGPLALAETGYIEEILRDAGSSNAASRRCRPLFPAPRPPKKRRPSPVRSARSRGCSIPASLTRRPGRRSRRRSLSA
jgi:SAM-dependent methyltransferase